MVIQLIKWLPGLLWEKLKKWTEKKLVEENRRLKEALKLKGNMVCEHSAYWIKDK